MTLPTIIEALDEPELFGAAFAGDSWRPWRAFLAALFKLAAPEDLASLARACTNRDDVLTAGPFRTAWLVVGRRAGKSRVLALIAVFVAVFVSWRERLAVGETGVVMLLASDKSQAGVLVGYIKGLFRDVPVLRSLVTGETADSLELGSLRVAIEVHASNHRSIRGRTVIAALLDEAAFWRSETTANPAEEVVRALRPALATTNGLLIGASSPYGRYGLLWDEYSKHFGREGDATLVWQAASRTMNPSLDADFVATELEADPDGAAAEYLAEFRRDRERFISQEAVADAVISGRRELPPVAGQPYVGFCDPSGGSQDAMTLAVAHIEGDRFVLDCVRERRPPFSPESVVSEFAETLKSYGISSVHGDRYGGEWPREVFRNAGIAYKASERTKSELYLEVLPLLNASKVELLDHQRLLAQLAGLERRTSRAGKDTVDHGPGGHDDLVNAAAGALVLAKSRRVTNARVMAGPKLISAQYDWAGDSSEKRPRAVNWWSR